MQEMTPRAKDSLVSFGERLSTRIFAAYLTRLGVPAQQFDAWDLGLVTSDEFTNAEIDYAQSIPAVRAAMRQHAASGGGIPVVTGFVGKGRETGAPWGQFVHTDACASPFLCLFFLFFWLVCSCISPLLWWAGGYVTSIA